jgi:alpha-mannosidase
MLRSATAPDPEQDRGHHDFSFAIMPHTSRLLESGVYQQALRFVNPVSIRTVEADAEIDALKTPFEIIGADSIILDAVKRGEDDDETGQKSIVIRMFESLGGRSRGTLKM